LERGACRRRPNPPYQATDDSPRGPRRQKRDRPLSPLAEERGAVLLALSSSDATWDLIRSGWGPDVRAIDKALAWAFTRCAVDPARFGVIGFSDGASYTLALGRSNGDLFRRVVAYSPGILFDVASVGRPEFFVTHGTLDRVLSIETTRNTIVPGLLRAGYPVQYREFNGGHGVTQALMTETIDWFVRKV
jgi:phospholipase/carboxylesterase